MLSGATGHVISYSETLWDGRSYVSHLLVRKHKLREARWLARSSDFRVKRSFTMTWCLWTQLAWSVISVSPEHKSERKNWKDEKKNLQKVVNTLQHESRDHLLNFCCWKWTLFCRIFKSSWGYQVWQPLPKIKYQTSKHLTAQEPSIFLGCNVCQNCAWHFQAWKCLSTILPFNPLSRALGLKD